MGIVEDIAARLRGWTTESASAAGHGPYAGSVAVPFDRDFEPEYGRVDHVTPLVRRIVAENPGRFTFTGTGTYIVGHGNVAVIDPGPDLDAHVTALTAALDGETVTHILITHTHTDHSPAAAALKEATAAPTYGFGPHPVADIEARRAAAARKAEMEPEEPSDDEPSDDKPPGDEGFDVHFVPDVVTVDGDTIAGDGWTIEALHTPGHISNHLCFALREEKILFTGDHVMGWSTSVISPPDGNMNTYLDSLRLLLDRDDAVYRPTHGPPITAPVDHVEAFLAHRLERERDIVELLRSAGPSRITDLVPTLYADVDVKLHKAAGRSVHSHLLRLHETGVVDADGDPRMLSQAVWQVA